MSGCLIGGCKGKGWNVTEEEGGAGHLSEKSRLHLQMYFSLMTRVRKSMLQGLTCVFCDCNGLWLNLNDIGFVVGFFCCGFFLFACFF